MKTTVPIYVGPSRDHRTNVWSVVCPKCGHEFRPRETMFNWQSVECFKCKSELSCDYEKQTVAILDEGAAQ